MNQYQIIEQIGRGNYGNIFLVNNKKNQQQFVIKKLPTDTISEKERQCIENEIKFLNEMKHPNIVPFYESFLDESQEINIVMKFCDGGDLYKHIRNQNQKFEEQYILFCMSQIILALHYLHDQRILHRDLKTQNIFLSGKRLYLGDFGISKTLENTKEFANTYIGTPYYMSPELFNYQPYSYKSDIWSLGCVLYEMCNLKHAFNAQTINGLAIKIIKGNFVPVSTRYSQELRSFIDSLLIIKQDKRPSIFEIVQQPFVQTNILNYIISLSQEAEKLTEFEIDAIRSQIQSIGLTQIIQKKACDQSIKIFLKERDIILVEIDQNRKVTQYEQELETKQIQQQSLEKEIQKLIQYQQENFHINFEKKQQKIQLEEEAYADDFDDFEFMSQSQDFKKFSPNILQNRLQEAKKLYNKNENIIKQLNQELVKLNDTKSQFCQQEYHKKSDFESDDQFCQSLSFQQKDDQEIENKNDENQYQIVDLLKENLQAIEDKIKYGVGDALFEKIQSIIKKSVRSKSKYEYKDVTNILGEKNIGYCHLIDQVIFIQQELKEFNQQNF